MKYMIMDMTYTNINIAQMISFTLISSNTDK